MRGQVKLGRKGEPLLPFYVQDAARHRNESPAFIDRFSTGELSHRGDAFWQHWVISSFRGGQGQDVFEDVEMSSKMVGADCFTQGRITAYPSWVEELGPRIAYAQDVTAPITDPPWPGKWRGRGFAASCDEVSSRSGDVAEMQFVFDKHGTLAGDHGSGCSNPECASFFTAPGSFSNGVCTVCGQDTQGDDLSAKIWYRKSAYTDPETGEVVPASAWLYVDEWSEPVWSGDVLEQFGTTVARRSSGFTCAVHHAAPDGSNGAMCFASREGFIVRRFDSDGSWDVIPQFYVTDSSESNGHVITVALDASSGLVVVDDINLRPGPAAVQAGDYIGVGTEIMRVDNVNAGTKTLSVQRGALGSVAASHAVSTPVNVRTIVSHYPLVVGQPITAMASYMGQLYVAQDTLVHAYTFGRETFRDPLTGAIDFSVKDGKWSTFAAPILRADSHLVVAAAWGGGLYFAGRQSYHTKLYRVDEAGGAEVAAVRDNFRVESMVVYDGQLYLGGSVYDESLDRSFGKVYRLNGTSLEDVRIQRAVGGVSVFERDMGGIPDMDVWNGKLLIPSSQDVGAESHPGPFVYSAPDDAFSSLHPFESRGEPDSAVEGRVEAIGVFRGSVWVCVPELGVIRMAPDDSQRPARGFAFETSWFDAGLALADKLFHDLAVDVNGPLNGMWLTVSYRVARDGDWVQLGSSIGGTAEAPATDVSEEHRFTFDFPSDGVVAQKLQLRIELTYPPSAPPITSGKTWTVRGLYVRYLVEPEVRSAWNFSVVCADNIEGIDGRPELRSGADMAAYLWSLRRGRKPVMFEDTDGELHEVIVRSMSEYQPSINMEDGYESVVSLQLWAVDPEVV